MKIVSFLIITKKLIRIFNIFPRFFIAIHNLGLLNSFKVFINKFYLKKKISKIKTRKFGTIYWRSYCDYGVISHLFSSQIGFDTKNDKVKTIIDIGANIGIETKRLRKLFPNSKIISVEPDISNYKILELNTKDDNNITILNKAIWNKKTTLEIKNHFSNNSQTFYVTEKKREETINEIDSLSIKDILNEQNLNSIDIIKIDTEGAEVKIFDESCDKWISSVKVIIVECPDKEAPLTTMKIFKAFERNNLKFNTYINGENLVFIRENCNFIPVSTHYY